jgi:hypothetical protein
MRADIGSEVISAGYREISDIYIGRACGMWEVISAEHGK